MEAKLKITGRKNQLKVSSALESEAEWSKNNRKTNDFCQLATHVVTINERTLLLSAINEQHKQVESIDWKIGKLMILIDFVHGFNIFLLFQLFLVVIFALELRKANKKFRRKIVNRNSLRDSFLQAFSTFKLDKCQQANICSPSHFNQYLQLSCENFLTHSTDRIAMICKHSHEKLNFFHATHST